MITKEKMLWSFVKLSQLISKEMYEYQSGEFVCGYWGLKVNYDNTCNDYTMYRNSVHNNNKSFLQDIK